MLGLREIIQAEVLLSLMRTQQAYMSEHPGARLLYQAPRVKADDHVVQIVVSPSLVLSGSGKSYEDALGVALEDGTCRDYLKKKRAKA